MHQPLATVFGGSGFIGRYVVRALAEQGWRVRVAVRRPHTAYDLRFLGRVGQIEPVQANIRDEDSVARAVKGADAVINLVGILYPSGAQSFDAVQTRGPARIARAALAAGVKHLVHVSAIGADLNGAAEYARTKAAGEAEVRRAFPSAIILRPSVVFGPEDGFFNLFAWLGRFLPVLPLIGGGTNRMQPVYVGDVARAVTTALSDAKAAGQTFELGGPRTYSIRELMELTVSITGARVWLVPVPVRLAMIKAFFLGLMPKPLLTMDQVRMLSADNVVAPGAKCLADLGITPTPAESVLPGYLRRYRRSGEYEPTHA